MKKLLLVLLFFFGAQTLSSPTLALDSFDALEGTADYFEGDTTANQIEETLQTINSYSATVSPTGAMMKPVVDEMNQGADDPEPVSDDLMVFGFVIAIMLAAWLLLSDFIDLFRNLKQKAVKAILGKIITIVITFVSAWIPGWNVFFMILRVILKVVKVIRTAKRVASAAKAVSNTVVKQ